MIGGEDAIVTSEQLLIMPDNWESVQVFLALNRCWRIDSFNGHYFGLDRPSIESTLRLMSIRRKRHLAIFEDLRIMENTALEILNADNGRGTA